MNILAIESSCDEFSVAILKNEKIVANIISSQIKDHKKFGGVVPELASRLHVENFYWVLETALLESKTKIEELDCIAYTAKPGLIGSLIVGKIVAETLANYLNIKLYPLDHLEGHIYSSLIETKVQFPALALITSGGHTELYLMKKDLDFCLLGSTQDDAVGECYDKVARKLNLEYPGGPKIDMLSKQSKEEKYMLPTPKDKEKYDFSFSGIKTASINLINKLGAEIDTKSFALTFQKTCINYILNKVKLAIKEYPEIKSLLLGGGTSANSLLREEIKKLENKNLKVYVPKMEYCTDNAAMIARLCLSYLKEGN
ncbi:tRNA (adenosine(37)-N6)-threonylcarbamoyltransferase complex transferase subunit TsaD [Spiroplasma endosymbiont of Crioceris asparagi]|uniref:tRNA (adenosine(37)-N6)-threonylcarbamoyltransferase complex transferase subunit TsaD n=1 Tax=Spiroplasma endosymbiont of Crioceris asparagi TaxID=3066286 RepID=UPI0030CE1EF8